LLEGINVALTLNVAIGILRVTHRLVMTIICAKLYFNPTTNNTVKSRSRMRDGLTDVRTDDAAAVKNNTIKYGHYFILHKICFYKPKINEQMYALLILSS